MVDVTAILVGVAGIVDPMVASEADIVDLMMEALVEILAAGLLEEDADVMAEEGDGLPGEGELVRARRLLVLVPATHSVSRFLARWSTTFPLI